MFGNVLNTQMCSGRYDPTSFALTPNCTLTVFEHVAPVEPHGIFSVITPKVFSSVVLSHLSLNDKERKSFLILKTFIISVFHNIQH